MKLPLRANRIYNPLGKIRWNDDGNVHSTISGLLYFAILGANLSALCILNKLLVVKLNFQALTFLRSITRIIIIAAWEKASEGKKKQ